MKTSRKLVVALTLAAMIATMIGTGVVSAAPTAQTAAFSDISGNAYETAIDWIAALGIVGGRPGGIYDPAASITREEMAKVVINFIGQNALAQQLSASGSSFKDASKIADWAIGYVNAAAALQIINGYPDGTFRPKDPVKFQEVVTMLIRAIGDDFRAKMISNVYPANYLTAGAILGVTAGLSTATAALPATRGEVAQLTFNAGSALRYTPTSYGPQGQVLTYDLLGGNTAPYEHMMFTSATNADAYEFSRSSNGTATVTAVSGSTIYFSNVGRTLADKVTLLNASSFSDLVGAQVNYAADASGNITLIEVPKGSAAKTVSGTLNDSATVLSNSGFDPVSEATYGRFYVQNSSGTKFILFKDGSLVQLASSVKWKLNGADKTAPDKAWNGLQASIQLNDSNLGSEVDVTSVDAPNAWVGEKPTATWNDNGTTFAIHVSDGGATQSVKFTSSTKVTLNGSAVSAKDAYAKIQSDVAAGIYPVLQISTDGNGFSSGDTATSVSITDTQISGKLTNVSFSSAGTSLTIGSTTALITSTYRHAANAQSTATTDKQFPVGSDVIALTVNGAIQYVFGASPLLTDGTYIANVTGAAFDASANQWNVTFDQAGTSYTLALDQAPGAGFATGYVVLTVASGKVTTSSVTAIDQDVAGGDTLEVSGLGVSGGAVSRIEFDDATTGQAYDGTQGLALDKGAAPPSPPSADVYGAKWAVYDANGKYLGDSALALSAQFTAVTVTVGSTPYYVLIKQ